MTRAEILAHNAGVAALAAIATASADALRARLTKAPTRFAFAIAALDGIVEATNELLLPLPPDESGPPGATLRPPPPAPATLLDAAGAP